MKRIEPWKPIALAILFYLIATGINEVFGNRSRGVVQATTPIQPSVQAYVPASVDTQRQNTEAAAHQKFLDRYLNGPLPRKSAVPTFGLVVVSENRTFDYTLNNALSRRFKDTSNDIRSFPLKPTFVSDGLFNTIFNGSSDALQKLDLGKAFDGLVFGKETVEYATNPTLENVMTATMQLEVVVVPVNGTGPSQTWSFRANGAGFKQSDARALAVERIIKQIESASQMKLSN